MAQVNLGLSSRVVSSIDSTLYDAPFRRPLHTLAAVADQYLVKRRDFAAPVSLYRNRLHRRLDRDLAGDDVLHIHWPHGLVDVDNLDKLARGRPVVWTLHDMAALTGGCHYSLGCSCYLSGTGNCSAVRAPWQGAITRARRSLSDSLHRVERLRLVSPSQWLADEAKKSEGLGDLPIDVIPNPLASATPGTTVPDSARADLGIPSDHTVYLVSASNLSDPVKAVGDALEAFQSAFSDSDSATLLVVGRGKLTTSQKNIRHLGYLDAAAMQTVLAASDYQIVTSLAENQPLAISEAQASGVSLIARNSTGLPEHTTYDADSQLFNSQEELVHVLGTTSEKPRSPQAREELSSVALSRYEPHTIAQQYVDIYESLLAR